MKNLASRIRVLAIDDDLYILDLFKLSLEELDYEVRIVSNSQEAIELIKQESFDLIFTDIHILPFDGFTVLEETKKHTPDTPVIVISGFEEFDYALKAVEFGAYQILQKPIEIRELRIVSKKAIEFHRIKAELREIKGKYYNLIENTKFITQNKQFLKNIQIAEQVARSNINVLIQGESGTGKEIMAEFIHAKSSRKDKPFIKVNCAGIPEGVLETELLGQVKDVSGGVTKDRRGKFELAEGGTIFLDEVGAIPTAFQSKLLRILETKEFERKGDTETRKADVRILSSTRIDLEAAIQEKTFREDLFFRLNGIAIKIPPLRERIEDLDLLIYYYMERFSKNKRAEITRDALFLLKSHYWRGNARELESVIHRALVLAKENPIDVSHLPDEFRNVAQNKTEGLLTLEEMKRKHIEKILSCTVDYKEAAKILNVDLVTLWRKRKRYSI